MCNCSGFIGEEVSYDKNTIKGTENHLLGGLIGKPYSETKLGQSTVGKGLNTVAGLTPIGFMANIGKSILGKKGTATADPSGAREVSEEERNPDGSPSSNTGLYIGIGVGVIILIVVGIFLYKKFSK